VYFLVLKLLLGLDMALILILALVFTSSRRPRCHVLGCFHTCICISFRAASFFVAFSIPFLASTVCFVDDLETRQPRCNA
jgi:hypothetical protein